MEVHVVLNHAQASGVSGLCVCVCVPIGLGPGGIRVPTGLQTLLLAPRSWPRLSCYSGHSPRLSGVPPNPPCTAPRPMNCLPASSVQPALCLSPTLSQQGPISCHAKESCSPSNQSMFLCLDILPQDPPHPQPWEMRGSPMCSSSLSGIGGSPKD